MGTREKVLDYYSRNGDQWDFCVLNGNIFNTAIKQIYEDCGINNPNQLKKKLGCSNDTATKAFRTPREMSIGTFTKMMELLEFTEKDVHTLMHGWLERPIYEAEEEYPVVLERLMDVSLKFLMQDDETQELMIRVFEAFGTPDIIPRSDPYRLACWHLWNQLSQLRKSDPHMLDYFTSSHEKPTSKADS